MRENPFVYLTKDMKCAERSQYDEILTPKNELYLWNVRYKGNDGSFRVMLNKPYNESISSLPHMTHSNEIFDTGIFIQDYGKNWHVSFSSMTSIHVGGFASRYYATIFGLKHLGMIYGRAHY